MIRIPPLTPIQKDQLRRYFSIYAITTIIVSIACYYIFPEEWNWVAYVPDILLVIAVIITWLVLALRGIVISGPEFVYIGRKRVSCCQFCSMAERKENVVTSKFPVIKCRETAKVCYTPMKIPRWCPYAK